MFIMKKSQESMIHKPPEKIKCVSATTSLQCSWTSMSCRNAHRKVGIACQNDPALVLSPCKVIFILKFSFSLTQRPRSKIHLKVPTFSVSAAFLPRFKDFYLLKVNSDCLDFLTFLNREKFEDLLSTLMWSKQSTSKSQWAFFFLLPEIVIIISKQESK